MINDKRNPNGRGIATRTFVCLYQQPVTWNFTIVHFKRLGSRHFVTEIITQSILLKYNMIFRKTNLKQFLKYVQKVSNHPDYQILCV